MAISLSECTEVVEEIKQAFTGGLIQKIHQPQPFILTFAIRVPGVSCTLLISVEPKFARVHLTSNKLENPQAPLVFCQYLRSHLEGGRIVSIEQESRDRIAYVNIVKSSSTYVLVIALTGNQSNVFVLNEERVILRSLKPSRLKVGERYAPPVIQKTESLPSEARYSFKKVGVSHEDRFPISAELERKFQREVESQRRLEWFQTRTTQIRKALKQTKRREQSLEADLRKAEKYREYQRYGELLKGQLHTVQPRQAVIEVVDYYDPTLPILTLPLNVLKDPVWNMEDYFRKYQKYLSTQEHLLPRLEKARKDLESLKKELAKLEKEELEELVAEPTNRGSKNPANFSPASLPFSQRGEVKGKNRDPNQHLASDISGKSIQEQKAKLHSQTKHYRTFESFDGLTILVGKSAKDNDYLTLKVAKPDDLWLHARGCPGSHVVVRLDKATDVPHETLRDAATLALFYSDLKKSGKGEVIHTLRKFVKKSKGLKAGAVHVTREKSIWIELKKERLDRLKGGI